MEPYVFTQIIRDDNDVVPRWQQRIDIVQQTLAQSAASPERPAHGKPRYYALNHGPATALTKTAREKDLSKRVSPLWWAGSGLKQEQAKSDELPAHVFEQLPHEIYSCILGYLLATYTDGPKVDLSGRKRAIRTICLTSKRWAKVGIEHMYRDLWLPSSATGNKRARRFSMAKPKSRLELLLRTLDEAPSVRLLIRRIHITEALARELDGIDTSNAQRKAAHNMIREVVETCTEAELVTGYNPPATLEHAEWYKLLFSRPRINAHAWSLDLRKPPVFSMGRFTDFHEKWQRLETLVLCKTDSSDSVLGLGIISALTNSLRSLRHLMISGFGKDDFHNGTLFALKPLRSLRLENLEGVTDQGIFQLSQSRNAFSLESLSLIGLELASMRTIQALLENMPRLRRFRLVQDASPTLLMGSGSQNRRNALGSASLEYLHWDTLLPGPATESLAQSIKTGSFPSLRTLKALCDPNGSLQALCRPILGRPLTTDDLTFLDTIDQDRYTRSLRLSRLQAHLRVRDTQSQPSVNIVVSDEEKQIQQTDVIGSYVGDVMSKVEYVLEPDVQGEQEALSSLGHVTKKADRSDENDSGVERLCGFDALF